MPDEALLDAPETEVEDLGAETESTETESSSTEKAEGQGEAQQTDSAPVISDANGQLKLSEKARAELDRIKAENPKLAREMRAALFDRQTLAQKGLTVKQALETIEAYEAEGGSDAVQQAKEELGAWQSLDEDFQKGDPKFVDDIAAGNPEAFAKIGPAVMVKLAQTNPEIYSHEVSKVFAQDLAANDVVLTMRLMQREIAAIPEANRGPVEQLWNQLAAYVDRVNGMARKAPEVKQNTAQPQNNTVDERERNLTIREFSAERTAVKDKITASEFAKNAQGRKLPAEKISTIQELYESALDRLVKAIPGHTGKVDRFLAAGDKAGYRKHMEAAIRSKAPEAMAQAFRRAGVGAKPGPVAKPAPKAAPGAAKPAAVTTGFTRVATKPAHNDVNWPATNSVRKKPEDSGKYIMRDGSKVLFTR